MAKTQKMLSEKQLDKNTVIVRANLNVKFKNGEIADDSKIKAIIPTLQYLQKANCKTILIGHMGDAIGEYNDELSFIPIRFAIGKMFGKPLKFVNINNSANSIKFMEPGEVLLLENLSFCTEEFSRKDEVKKEFIKKISDFAEYYVDESFGVSQTLASTRFLPELLKPLQGLNYESELSTAKIAKKFSRDRHISLLGGKAIEKKVKMAGRLVTKSEKVLIGGELGNLFLKAKGYEVGVNTFDKALIKEAKEIIKAAKSNKCELVLPLDVRVINAKKEIKEISVDKVKDNYKIVDIGSKTSKEFIKLIEDAKFLVINGPLGLVEDEQSSKGTIEVFEIASLISTKYCYKITGGEDTMAVMNNLKIKHKKFNHVSVSIVEFINFL